MKRRRTVVIGLDGATFDVIKPMVASGQLPNIAYLMENGCHGTLISSIPPITAPAWASFMTGKDPSNHGLYLFFHYRPELFFKGDFPLVTTASIKAKTIWEILKDKGKKVIALNVPMTYPPFPVDGVMISGMGTAEGSKNFIYPLDLTEEIEKDVGYCKIVDPRFRDLSKNQNMLKNCLESLRLAEKKRLKLASYLLDKFSWDFFMIVFTLTDRVQHFLWGVDDNVQKAYEEVDGLVGELLEKIDKDTSVFIMSDHGFGKQNGFICINKWLMDNGYLYLKKTSLANILGRYSLRTLRVTLERLAVKARVPFLLDYLPKAFREKVIWVPYLRKNGMAFVDWSKTKAYGAAAGIRINLKGREPFGIIDGKKDYEELKNEIIKRLHGLTHPDTKKKIMDVIVEKEKIYKGPFISEAPDILFIAEGMSYPQSDRLDSNQLFASTKLKGTHRLNGIFIGKGEGIKKGTEIEGASIVDVLPTLLYSMGLPIPDDLNGKVLRDCFDEKYILSNLISFEETGDFTEMTGSYSEEEEREIRLRLKELGYLE